MKDNETEMKRGTFRLLNYCEIDPYASAAYCSMHGVDPSLNFGDITMADEEAIGHPDLVVGGSPCQDFSVSGKREGARWTCRSCGHSYNPLEVRWEGRGSCPSCGSFDIEHTRSSLIVEWLRVVRIARPKIVVYENVPALSTQFRPTFDMFVAELEGYGYNARWAVLNAVAFGSAQKRRRLYLVGIRSDVDNGKFAIPPGNIVRGRRFIDVVDHSDDGTPFETRLGAVGMLKGKRTEGVLDGLAWSKPVDGRSAATIHVRDIATRFVKPLDYAVTICACEYKGFRNQDANAVLIRDADPSDPTGRTDRIRLRRLSPLEAWRLMGFSDSDYARASEATVRGRKLSRTQLYKMAGNSICVEVLYGIFEALMEAQSELFEDLTVGSYFSGIGAFETALERLYAGADPYGKIARFSEDAENGVVGKSSYTKETEETR